MKSLMDIGKMSENPVINPDLGIVSKELNPIVNIGQLQNIINTIGEGLENGTQTSPSISFVGDRTTGFYYDANTATLYGVSQGKRIFSFNGNGFNISAPYAESYSEITVTGNNITNANLLESVVNYLVTGTGEAVLIGSGLTNGSIIYVRNATDVAVSIYPTSGDAWFGLNVNQPVTISPNQFIAIRVFVDSETGKKTYYGNVFAGIDASGDAVFQNIAVQLQAKIAGTLTVGDGGAIVLKKANLTNESGYMGVSCVGNLSLNATTGTTAPYQFNVVTQSEPNGIIYLPAADQVANGATIYVKNVTSNNILLYPPSGQSIESTGKDTPINIAPKSGGSFTYVNGYLAHHILLSTKPDGNVIMPGAAAYSTYSMQDTTVTYGSNQSNATGQVNITGQIIFIDNQYTDVNQNAGTGNQVNNPAGGAENVSYTQNVFILDDQIPVGTVLFLLPNYNFTALDSASQVNFTLQTQGESTIIQGTGLSLPNGINSQQQVTLPNSFNYLLIKTQNQFGNAIWVVVPLGWLGGEGGIQNFGGFQQDGDELYANFPLTCEDSLSANSITSETGITGETLNLSYSDLTVNIGATQEGACPVSDGDGFLVNITSVLAGQNAITISSENGSGKNVNTFIIRNATGSEVVIFPASGGYINALPQNQSYTMGGYESILVTGYIDDNGNIHLMLLLLGLSENVQGTSKYITALPSAAGIEVNGELEVTGGNILCPNVTTSQNVVAQGYLVKSYTYGIEASGNGQSDATVLDSIVNVVTQVGGNYCVKPTAGLTAGTCIEIYNRTAQTIKVYPANGEQIETFNQNDFCLLATNQAVKMTVIEQNDRRMWITAMIGGAITQT